MGKPLIQRCLELLSHLSLRSLYRLGNVLALLVGNTPNRVARTARQNVALCFPELDAVEPGRV